ncbi:MAG: hypothetical protein EXS69_00940 [Candidatus Zambryskibacteria bacterium]|nr:hypothetical protein [Candidatus Zambryskibacteria bacterium]
MVKKVLFISIVCSVLFLGVANDAFAEITSSYTVDEKSQVMFGDSTVVSGHEGLENYTHEYVDSYLHLTFTYTHHTITFSSFPPLLYITALDPTTTSSPTVRTTNVIYQLLSGTHGTDWYSYDVQFDATGYTTIVKKAGTTEIVNAHVTVSGQTSTDWAALANNFDMVPSTLFSMSFTPFLIFDAPASSDSSSGSSSSHRDGDRPRCVDTLAGLYCLNEEVREYYIRHNMGMLIYILQELVTRLSAGEI